MKHLIFLFSVSLFLISCGARSGHFKLEGRFAHLNNGELYVYSPDAAIHGLDTIKVEAGRFAYEIPCERPSELILIFPNFSEQPVFAESGGSVDVKVDASHLKMMQVKGTKDNELMTQFREQIATASPPEEQKYAAQFIKDHPESHVSVYLLRKYFLKTSSANYSQGIKLAEMMLREQPKNGSLVLLKQQLSMRNRAGVGQKLPIFSVTTVEGKELTSATLQKADVTVLFSCATWSFSSMEQARLLQELVNKSQNRLQVLGISVDADKSDCIRTLHSNVITFPVVCDGAMLEGKLLQQLGMASVPTNILLRKGKVVERDLNISTLRERLESYLK